MRKLHNEASAWSKAVKQRSKFDKTLAAKRTRTQTMLIGISYLLLGLSFWSVLAIYGPVVKAEAGYTYKNLALGKGHGDWWEWMVPDFSFDLVPEVISAEWGIVIPKIFLQETVVANVDPTAKESYLPALNVGIAHAAGTDLPGQGGQGYYFAHSSGMNVLSPQKQAAFYLLGKLVTGDEVDVYHYGEKYIYKVVETKVVEANDVSFLSYSGENERIVLQTCWPVGTSRQRLLVFAERV